MKFRWMLCFRLISLTILYLYSSQYLHRSRSFFVSSSVAPPSTCVRSPWPSCGFPLSSGHAMSYLHRVPCALCYSSQYLHRSRSFFVSSSVAPPSTCATGVRYPWPPCGFPLSSGHAMSYLHRVIDTYPSQKLMWSAYQIEFNYKAVPY